MPVLKKHPMGAIFLLSLCLCVLFPFMTVKPAAAAEANQKEDVRIQAMKALRKEARHRQRRIIFNNDGDDAMPYAAYNPLVEGFLKERTTPLLGSQVDTIFYATAESFGFFVHRTKVGATFTTPTFPCEGKSRRNITPDLIALGTDPLQLMVEFCRKNRIEVFWSMRMNDTHDAGFNDYAPALFSPLKQAHPEYLVGSRDKKPERGGWTAVDYTRPEIRELAFRYVEEVCRNYDIDGLELDFLRHPHFFKSVSWGGRASRAELDMMTDLVRRVRKMADEEAIKKGHPILVAVHVPDSLEYCRDIGLDLECWLGEELVDILVTGEVYQLNPWLYSVQLGHKYDIPVYARLGETRVNGEPKGMPAALYRESDASFRGRALQAWASGVDGIYMFNFFDSRSPLWRELGDPQTMLTSPKTYFASPLGNGKRGYLQEGEKYMRVFLLSPDTPPHSLSRNRMETVPLLVDEDVAGAEKAGFEPLIKCRFWTKGLNSADALAVKLNGYPLKNAVMLSGGWLEYPVAPEYLKKGANQFGLTSLQAATPVFEGDPGTAEIKQWDMNYVCTKVLAYPEQLPWRRLVNGKDGIERIHSKSQLFLADRGTGPVDMTNLIYPWDVGPSDTEVVEARLRVVATSDPLGVCLRLANNNSVEFLSFEKDRIGLQFAKLSCPLDTTNELHTYRVVLKGSDIQVYVDGKLKLDGKGKFTTPAADQKNWLKLDDGLDAWNKRSLLFGSATGPGTGEAYWEYIRFASDAKPVSIRDLILSVSYVKKGTQ
ncbi:MAG: hypothetical protein NT011_07130 [Kiritimatiellaeota bacterium]|nr:hypothetical protein [Kiritimatiellota bacterium]